MLGPRVLRVLGVRDMLLTATESAGATDASQTSPVDFDSQHVEKWHVASDPNVPRPTASHPEPPSGDAFRKHRPEPPSGNAVRKHRPETPSGNTARKHCPETPCSLFSTRRGLPSYLKPLNREGFSVKQLSSWTY